MKCATRTLENVSFKTDEFLSEGTCIPFSVEGERRRHLYWTASLQKEEEFIPSFDPELIIFPSFSIHSSFQERREIGLFCVNNK